MKTPEEKKEYLKNWHLANKAKEAEYRELNREHLLAKRKEWEKDNPNNNKERAKKWRDKNPEKAKENSRNSVNKRKLVDETFRLKCNIKSMISKLITRNGYIKKDKTNTILGCTYEEFKQHIESNFESWMNWDNYGRYNGEEHFGWDVDHIIPISSANTEEDIIKLNHYSNLRPLCSKVNRDIKRNFTKITLELSMDF